MIKRADLKRSLAGTLRALQLMLFGAFVLALWLDWTGREVNGLSWSLMMACLIAGALANVLAPQPGPSIKTPSPRASGVGVIAVTGAFATIAMAKGGMIGEANPVGATVIALVTVVACVAMWRFATRYAGEIGEARFPTT